MEDGEEDVEGGEEVAGEGFVAEDVDFEGT